MSGEEMLREKIKSIFGDHTKVMEETLSQIEKPLVEFVEVTKGVIEEGGKLLIFGNGGSASDSLHFVSEMVGAMSGKETPLPAVSLVSDPSTITSLSNDFGFKKVFAKQIEAIGKEGDMVVAISTSGNSPNCVEAIETAKKMELVTSALLGGEGGRLREKVDYPVIVPSDNTQRIQEIHIIIIHIACEELKKWGGEL